MDETHALRFGTGAGVLITWLASAHVTEIILYESGIYQTPKLYILSFTIPIVFSFMSYITGLLFEIIPPRIEEWLNNEW